MRKRIVIWLILAVLVLSGCQAVETDKKSGDGSALTVPTVSEASENGKSSDQGVALSGESGGSLLTEESSFESSKQSSVTVSGSESFSESDESFFETVSGVFSQGESFSPSFSDPVASSTECSISYSESLPEPNKPDRDGYYYDVESVVLYLYYYGELPSNYLTKTEAKALGWRSGTPETVKEGAAIGGDYFGNREGLLPAAAGRSFTECDIETNGKGSRGSKRLVYSSDGLYFYTSDHYMSFTQLTVENGEVIWN